MNDTQKLRIETCIEGLAWIILGVLARENAKRPREYVKLKDIRCDLRNINQKGDIMRNNLKLTLICITALMIICSHLTATADVRYPGSITRLSGNPDPAIVGDTLEYFFSVRTSVSGDDAEKGIPDTITGFHITFSFPDDIILHSFSVGSSVAYDLKTRTATASGLPPKSRQKVFHGGFVAIASGTGDIRITGTVTTTNL